MNKVTGLFTALMWGVPLSAPVVVLPLIELAEAVHWLAYGTWALPG